MREVVHIPAGEVRCAPADVLALQGVPRGARLDGRIAAMLSEGISLYESLAAPAGVLEEVDGGEFAEIYAGAGKNEPRTPLALIHPRAERLCLFAVTVGGAVSRRISELFQEQEFALGAMLDAAASQGAELAAAYLEACYGRRDAESGAPAGKRAFLRYSPGYCGWHVSGQKRLFARLRPEEIGITLRESCLMEPLKSISGVIAGGPAGIHDFENEFPFCAECKGKECRARIRRALANER
ncbi:MAG: hypothetical protein HY812_21680 [Planctomycetes bacterium]|nr:hypothetical protein [Planctomycetota bacterium]